jgi:hypothetical protein
MSATQRPPAHWTPLDSGAPGRVLDLSRLGTGIGAVHGIGLPIHVYPLYENAFRAWRGQGMGENNQESARLYAAFAKVAERNPGAWSYGERAATEETIGTVSRRNRMICAPCELCLDLGSERYWGGLTRKITDPLLMNAFNNVNLAAAVLLTSVEFARELGVPESKWIYPLGGAGTRDSYDCEYLEWLLFP